MGGHDQSERPVAINRNGWSQSSGARSPVCDPIKAPFQLKEIGGQSDYNAKA
jgi:hypothetical protein